MSVRRRKLLRTEQPDLFTPTGIHFARCLGGERVLHQPPNGGLVLPLDYLPQHLLVAGATNSGKSETVLRIAYELALKDVNREWGIFVLDPKGDSGFAARFLTLQRLAGRSPRMFPHEHFDMWRGGAESIIEKLLAAIDYADKGAATYFRDVAEVAVQLACRFKSGPPRSSGEFLYRLAFKQLTREYHGNSSALSSLEKAKVDETRSRYEALFGRIGNRLDGSWAWEDADSGYLLLESLSSKRAVESMARMLFADYADYFSTERKSKNRKVWLAADEFASVASSSAIGDTMRQARSFGAGVAVITQTMSGLGDNVQFEDVLGNVGTVVLHRMPKPELLTALAGTRKRFSSSRRYDLDGNPEGITSQEMEYPMVDPNKVRTQEAGMAWVIRHGRAARAKIARAPEAKDLDLQGFPATEEIIVPPPPFEDPADEVVVEDCEEQVKNLHEERAG